MEPLAFSSLTGIRNETSSAAPSTLGQDDFLRLLTTQLMNQSPLDPMDNEAFVAQMAQFSSVSGIAEMNESIKALRTDLGGDRLGEAAAYVGRTALVPAAEVAANGDPVSGAAYLESSAASLTVEITDQNGALVRRLYLGPQDAGLADYRWDGRDNAGDPAGNGPFKLAASTGNASGEGGPVPLYVEGRVASVAIDGKITMLSIVGIGDIRADQVRALS